jgi:hypothetical protein
MMGLKNRVLGMVSGVVLAVVCVLACSALAAARDVALVTGKNSPVRAMKAADLARTIKTTHKWPDGSDLLVVLTDPSSPEMRIVAEKLLGLTSDEFRRSIDAANKARATFLVVPSDEEALRTLQGNPTAIALVNVYSINSSVNVSKIDGKLPLEPGYILHSQ